VVVVAGSLPPVLIVSADGPAGLGAARSLAALGMDLYGIAGDMSAYACRSKAWTAVFPAADLGDPDACAEVLLDVRTRLPGRPVLLATGLASGDGVVTAMSRHRDRLAEHFDFVLPPADTVDVLSDKVRFQQWAGEHGFRVPEGELTSDFASLSRACERIDGPVIVKPTQRTVDWHQDNVGDKAFVVRTRRDLEQLKRLDGRQMIVQRWVDGRDSRVRFCLAYLDRSGQVVTSQTGRKLLQWPVERGSTAICVTDSRPDLTRLAHDLFAAAGVRGLASLEVKEDDDGSLYVTEPTIGRFDLQSEVADLAGAGIAVAAYRDAAGLPPAPPRRVRRRALLVVEPNAVKAIGPASRTRRLDLRTLVLAMLSSRRWAGSYLRLRDSAPIRAAITRGAFRLIAK
jgi:D-aspartate ligase